MARLLVALGLVVGLLLVGVPVTSAHSGSDARQDPEGDFAKKPMRPDFVPFAYAGAPCPLTDLLSVETEAAHEGDHGLPWDSTLVHLQLANLTIDPGECPFYVDTNVIHFDYAFVVRPSNAVERVKVYSQFRWHPEEGYGNEKATVRWFDGGSFYTKCRICQVSVDRPNGTMTMALPQPIAEPPYRHVNAYAIGETCVPRPPNPTFLDFCHKPVKKISTHLDVVPNLGEGEWSLYTDESDGPVDRLLDG